jgi:predicted TIM-barrel fold metal-dependent hydrolase
VIDNTFVADVVVHPWNLSPENQNPNALNVLEAVYGAHRLALDDAHSDYMLKRDEIFSDISFETIATAEFVESPVDFAVLHSLPCLGFTIGHLTLPDRAVAFRNKHPNRFKCYGTVGTPIIKTAIDELKRQVDDLGIDGIKLYPSFFYDDRGEAWRLDGADYATPLLEAAQKLGIRHIAVHKALWLGPAPKNAFDIDDLDSPLRRFPDLSFEMVHGGTAFIDETIRLMNNNPNLYLTLETTFSYIIAKRSHFDRAIGKLVGALGSDRLLFASGNNLSHPAPLIKAFANYQFAEEHMDRFKISPLTDLDRRKMLGLNAARLHGLDVDDVIAKAKVDDFTQARERGIPIPWSEIRT